MVEVEFVVILGDSFGEMVFERGETRSMFVGRGLDLDIELGIFLRSRFSFLKAFLLRFIFFK